MEKHTALFHKFKQFCGFVPARRTQCLVSTPVFTLFNFRSFSQLAAEVRKQKHNLLVNSTPFLRVAVAFLHINRFFLCKTKTEITWVFWNFLMCTADGGLLWGLPLNTRLRWKLVGCPRVTVFLYCILKCQKADFSHPHCFVENQHRGMRNLYAIRTVWSSLCCIHFSLSG